MPNQIKIIDDLVPADLRTSIITVLRKPGWQYGWKSDPKNDQYTFWHKHFAGNRHSDHTKKDEQYDCSEELLKNSLTISTFWKLLSSDLLSGHTLLRCYANGYPYGTDGTMHTDTILNTGYTLIYYPHEKWNLNWAGETVFFTADKTDIRQTVYPKPGRIILFNGTIPHAARGVSRSCPEMRVTLMFKTERSKDNV